MARAPTHLSHKSFSNTFARLVRSSGWHWRDTSPNLDVKSRCKTALQVNTHTDEPTTINPPRMLKQLPIHCTHQRTPKEAFCPPVRGVVDVARGVPLGRNGDERAA